MHTILHPAQPARRSRHAIAPALDATRKPNYDCHEQADAMRLVVYVPGVDASGVEIEARGSDLTIHARKAHFVRVNWSALHLESAQRDYLLRLRLGYGFDFEAMEAEISEGVLTVTLPKKLPVAETRRVA